MQRPTPALMIQATGSNAGKSTIVAGLARVLVRRGLKVAPFKPQNMSNNAAVAVDGGEIGRAQAVQARAARMPPSVHMNPVLLKPETDTGAQVIVQGKRWGTLRAKNYLRQEGRVAAGGAGQFCASRRATPTSFWSKAPAARPRSICAPATSPIWDLPPRPTCRWCWSAISIAAASSRVWPARIWCWSRTSARASAASSSTSFAATPDCSIDGSTAITRLTGWPSLGVVPWLPQAAWLPAEDAVDLDRTHGSSATRVIAVPMLARIANFDDLDPLGMEPGVKLVFVRPGEPIPGECRRRHPARQQIHHRRSRLPARARLGHRHQGPCAPRRPRARAVRRLSDAGQEHRRSRWRRRSCRHGRGARPARYRDRHDAGQIHHAGHRNALRDGRRHRGLRDPSRPQRGHGLRATRADDRQAVPDGAISADGRVQGTYVHGLFTGDAFRKAWLAQFGIASSLAYDARIESALDALADHLEAHLDIDANPEDRAQPSERPAPARRRAQPAAGRPRSADASARPISSGVASLRASALRKGSSTTRSP